MPTPLIIKFNDILFIYFHWQARSPWTYVRDMLFS